MTDLQVHDKQFEPYIDAGSLASRVAELASQITEDLSGKNPLFLSVLNGSFIFTADLLRALHFPLDVSFVKLASYTGTGSSGTVRRLIGLDESIRDREVVIVEDIVDTGLTMKQLLKDLSAMQPSGVSIVTLLFKKEAFRCDFDIDYCGFVVPDRFLVGYGLDYDGLGRNYSDIYTLKT